jgi:hypothetical protein
LGTAKLENGDRSYSTTVENGDGVKAEPGPATANLFRRAGIARDRGPEQVLIRFLGLERRKGWYFDEAEDIGQWRRWK